MIRSGNPALSTKTFENLTNTSSGVMTIEGTVSARIEKGFVANIFNTPVK